MVKTTLRPLLFNILYTLLLLLAFFQSPTVIAFHPTNETDKLALLAFKDCIHDDPLGVMDSWIESVHFCKWRGVSCSRRHEGRVVRLNLAGQKLVSSLPPHIGNLSFMRQINLSQNYYKGEIPQEVGHLFRLRSLDLRYNIFQGRIPSNLSSCSALVDIVFNYNELTGEIPIELGNLQNNLRRLAIFGNHLTGGIPQWLGNASLLEQLSLGQNNFRGSIPHGLGRLSNLQLLQLGQNDLSGYVPPSIFNLSSLSMLSVAKNQLHGRLPLDIGFTLPNLWVFSVGFNSFYGVLPPSLMNATKLGFLEMGYNNFSGVVPSNLGSLRNLKYLGLSVNHFEAAEGEGLGFVTSLTNCGNLQVLQLNKNHFKGELPASIANLSSTLQLLSIGMNPISGELPRYIEYGMNRKVSKPGDVYGFGILLLEMLTGKRPTDAIFKDGFNIHQFAKISLPERLVDVLDPSLLQEIEDAENPRARNRGICIRETLVAVARIGVLCSMETPNERMKMKQAAAELCVIRDKFI